MWLFFSFFFFCMSCRHDIVIEYYRFLIKIITEISIITFKSVYHQKKKQKNKKEKNPEKNTQSLKKKKQSCFLNFKTSFLECLWLGKHRLSGGIFVCYICYIVAISRLHIIIYTLCNTSSCSCKICSNYVYLRHAMLCLYTYICPYYCG